MLVRGNPTRYRLQESSDFAFFPIFANFCNSGVVEIFSFHRFGKGAPADNFSHFANLGRVQFRTRYRPQKPYDFAFLQYFTTREWRRFLRRVAFNALFTLTWYHPSGTFKEIGGVTWRHLPWNWGLHERSLRWVSLGGDNVVSSLETRIGVTLTESLISIVTLSAL